MKRAIAATIALAALISVPTVLGAGGGKAVTPVKELKIGVVNYTLSAPYFVGMSKAVQSEASPYKNITVLVNDANGDAAKFTSNVEDMLAKKVQGLILSAGPLEAAPAALAAIKKAGIPVVMVDRKLKGGDYTSWIGPSNFQIGAQDGAYIANRLKGKGTLLIIRGGPADNSIGLDRTNGVLSVVSKVKGIKVIKAPGWGNWSSDGGLTVMEDMLAKYKTINAVFCENDSMCLGAQKAIKDAGRSKQMFLAGVDGQKEALKAIMDGTNYAVTGLNDSDQIGRAGFNRLMSIFAGAQAPKDTVLPSPAITKQNAVKWYDPRSLF
jgi:ribose transport system substrate-binding protein